MAQGKGIRDWILQRLTALFLAFYVMVLFVFFTFHSNLDFQSWHAFFKQPWLQVATVLALLSLVVHAWIGVWTIATDYLKSSFFRLGFLGLVLIALMGYLAWGIKIVWS